MHGLLADDQRKQGLHRELWRVLEGDRRGHGGPGGRHGSRRGGGGRRGRRRGRWFRVSVGADVGVRVKIKARDRSSRSPMRRLQRVGLRVQPRLEATDNDCVAHSYGEVRQFFVSIPARRLYRSLLEVRGGLVLVAVAWVDMPDEANAIKLKRLLDRPGTGNITELSRERRRYRNVRFDGEHYASRREGATVVNAQAEPVGRVAATTLDAPASPRARQRTAVGSPFMQATRPTTRNSSTGPRRSRVARPEP